MVSVIEWMRGIKKHGSSGGCGDPIESNVIFVPQKQVCWEAFVWWTVVQSLC